VAAGAYSLARTSLTVFQQEARMNGAQFSNIMGMHRLASDAKRAGYQSSPDPATDPASMCTVPPAPLDTLLTAVRITDSTAGGGVPNSPNYPAWPVAVTDPENDRAPDRVRFAGNYTTSERFKLANVVANTIAVECDQLSVQRVFNNAQTGGVGFCAMFPPGAVVRVVNPAGKAQFVPVVGCAEVPNGVISYTSLTLTVAGLNAGGCTTDVSQGYLNPVDVVDYFLTNLNASAADNTLLGLPNSITNPSSLLPADAFGFEDPNLAGITGEPSRMTLVRRRLSATGLPIVASGEIIADYVADLKFSARVATPGAAGLTQIDFPGSLNLPAGELNRVRTLGIRLTTRARNPDRAEGPLPAPGPDAPLTLFHVFPTGSVARYKYARVRTMFMEVNLPNLGAYLPW